MGTKGIHVTVTEADHEKLKAVKGNRTWDEAILEEFGVREVTDDD